MHIKIYYNLCSLTKKNKKDICQVQFILGDESLWNWLGNVQSV